jgi:purine-binding chemotaxis protein CheW
VIQIPAGAVEPPSPLVTTIDSGYLRGIARLEGRLVILFDLDMLLSAEEKESVEAVHAAMA